MSTNYTNSLDVALSFGIAPVKEGHSYRMQCPLCHANNFILQSTGRFFCNCGCYSRKVNGQTYNDGSPANLEYWLRNACRLSLSAVPAKPQDSVYDSGVFSVDYWQSLLDQGIAPGGKAEQFLLSRAILPVTWSLYPLADGMRQGKPALMLGYLDQSSKLVTGRYRMYEPPTKQQRYATWRNGSNDYLFGLHLKPISDTLVIVEGELNSMSLYQAGVSSLGVPGQNCTPVLPASVRQQYQRVMVWADDSEKAKAWAKFYNAYGYTYSPVSNEIKLDANELLQRKTLQSFLVSL